MQPLRETAGQGDTLLALVYAGLTAAMLCDMLMPLARRCGAIIHFGMQLLLCACGAFLCWSAQAAAHCAPICFYPLAQDACCGVWAFAAQSAP